MKILNIILFLAILLTSCSQKPIVKKQNLRINIRNEPTTFDPRKGGDVVSTTMHFMLFEGLTRLNPNGTVSPAQAEKIELSRDRKQYTFHLRTTFWTDGSPVTAYDFEQAWKTSLSPTFPAPNAHLFYPIKNAEAAKKGLVPVDAIGITSLDAKTLQVDLESPTPYFLDLISFCSFFPVKQSLDSSWACHLGPEFICNGPFKMKSWKANQEIVVEKNPNYWASKNIQLETISISMIPHDMTILHMYENGQFDLLDMYTSPVPVEAQLELAKKGLLKIRSVGGSTITVFNTERPPFNNVNLRKAFAYAIDREAIVKNVTQLKELPALQAIPPMLKNNRAHSFFKDADKEAALAHLKLALQELNLSIDDISKLTFSYCSSDRNHKIAQALQHQWLTVLGVNVRLHTYELKVHLDKLSKGNFDFSLSQWYAQYNDQLNFLERFKSKSNVKNYPRWENSTFNALLEAASTKSSDEERLKVLEEAEAILMEEMPIAPIYHGTSAVIAQPYLKNVQVFNMGNPDFTLISMD